LRVLKLFLLRKDGGEKVGRLALNTVLANHLLCHSKYTEKPSSVTGSSHISFTLGYAILSEIKETFSPNLVSQQEDPHPRFGHFQVFNNYLFQ
jgi:hypothetical protein